MSPIKTDEYFLNMGPQHPSTHGVLRLILKLDGEVILDAIPDMGYIHRGLEKIAENRMYAQFTPLTDRMDYLCSMSNNLAYVLSVEKLAGIEALPRAQYLRVIVTELNRIASHLVWLGTFSLDLGAVTPFLYCFREREVLIDLFEHISGSRLTYNYMRFGGVFRDITPEFVEKAKKFIKEFNKRVDEYEEILTQNPIFLERTKNIGVIKADDAVAYGVSGPILRASGMNLDIRKAQPYSSYEKFDFDVPLGTNGDCWDRYICRVIEMRQSLRIVDQAINGIPEGAFRNKVPLNLKPPEGESYVPIESPRGELGFYIISKAGNKPYRLKVRAPSFCNLSMIRSILKGWKVADVVAILGTFDIVLGEIDR